MSPNPYLPANPEQTVWDAVVVGTGMGGATTGYAVASQGHRVLFLEKGIFLHGEMDVHGDGSVRVGAERIAELGSGGAAVTPEERLRIAHWPNRIRGRTNFGKLDFFAPLGCGSGGTTALYAAALERLRPIDFRPRGNFPTVTDSTLPEAWPIAYDDLGPYYGKAEELFRVRGTEDPLQPEANGRLLEPPPLSARDQHFLESFGAIGLHPYRVHAGYEFVAGCEECSGSLCPRGCKNDSARICLLPALERHGARILDRCEVQELEADGPRVKAVRCTVDGRELRVRAKVVVLAAGAYMSPAILLKSKSEAWPNGLANGSDLVGRNLMLHAADYVVIRPTVRRDTTGPQKSLALSDFYYSDGHKLGSIQSVASAISTGGIMKFLRVQAQRDRRWWRRLASPTPVWWRKLTSPFFRIVATLAQVRFNNAAVWASIIEDLPYHDNRILLDPDSPDGMRFEYRYTDELRRRVAVYRRLLTEKLAPHRVHFLSEDDNINYGHVCGTCRFGNDPRTSVLNADNRAHEVDNLYVADASFFPSSGGTNPSLTIAANALRVGEAIHRQLS